MQNLLNALRSRLQDTNDEVEITLKESEMQENLRPSEQSKILAQVN